ncbi:hypothetical protein GCM10017559_51920 [Streptosporangium longisporum]|uniref:Uncharacterized protein n=1 Tax=Streptosporangium longisporum TaxID=46187 RepID=A0ABN3Y6P4_9ACTN
MPVLAPVVAPIVAPAGDRAGPGGAGRADGGKAAPGTVEQGSRAAETPVTANGGTVDDDAMNDETVAGSEGGRVVGGWRRAGGAVAGRAGCAGGTPRGLGRGGREAPERHRNTRKPPGEAGGAPGNPREGRRNIREGQGTPSACR